MVAVIGIVAACNCGSHGAAGRPTPSGGWPGGAPSVDACAVDADCAIVVAGPGADDPCCDLTLTAAPMSVAFLQFMKQWRAQHCVQASCAPLVLPGHPAPCAHEARCIARRCGNACP